MQVSEMKTFAPRRLCDIKVQGTTTDLCLVLITSRCSLVPRPLPPGDKATADGTGDQNPELGRPGRDMSAMVDVHTWEMKMPSSVSSMGLPG